MFFSLPFLLSDFTDFLQFFFFYDFNLSAINGYELFCCKIGQCTNGI